MKLTSIRKFRASEVRAALPIPIESQYRPELPSSGRRQARDVRRPIDIIIRVPSPGATIPANER